MKVFFVFLLVLCLQSTSLANEPSQPETTPVKSSTPASQESENYHEKSFHFRYSTEDGTESFKVDGEDFNGPFMTAFGIGISFLGVIISIIGTILVTLLIFFGVGLFLIPILLGVGLILAAVFMPMLFPLLFFAAAGYAVFAFLRRNSEMKLKQR